MTVQDVILRARHACTLPIAYHMGAGGMKPLAPTPADSANRCDCSGFVCWCLGICRQTDLLAFVTMNGGWLNTDAMAYDIHGAQLLLRSCAPMVGAVVVYPGPPRRTVGHCGIIVATNPIRVIHCSSANWRATGRAVCETNDALFRTNDTAYGWCIDLRDEPSPPSLPYRIIESIITPGAPPMLDATLVHEQVPELWPSTQPTWWERLRSRLGRRTQDG